MFERKEGNSFWGHSVDQPGSMCCVSSSVTLHGLKFYLCDGIPVLHLFGVGPCDTWTLTVRNIRIESSEIPDACGYEALPAHGGIGERNKLAQGRIGQ